MPVPDIADLKLMTAGQRQQLIVTYYKRYIEICKDEAADLRAKAAAVADYATVEAIVRILDTNQ